MPRPKGSKNKTVNQKIDELIEDVQKLQVDEAEKAEAIDQLDDLLESPVDESETDKIFVGYHPITGAEVWQ